MVENKNCRFRDAEHELNRNMIKKYISRNFQRMFTVINYWLDFSLAEEVFVRFLWERGTFSLLDKGPGLWVLTLFILLTNLSRSSLLYLPARYWVLSPSPLKPIFSISLKLHISTYVWVFTRTCLIWLTSLTFLQHQQLKIFIKKTFHALANCQVFALTIPTRVGWFPDLNKKSLEKRFNVPLRSS